MAYFETTAAMPVVVDTLLQKQLLGLFRIREHD